MRRLVPPGCVSERNVTLSLAIAVLGSLVVTIAHGHLFTAFIFELFGSNSSVGLLESASGFCALAAAVPVGLAVDKVSRTRLLRYAAALGLLAAVSGALAVVLGPVLAGPAEGGVRGPPGPLFTSLLLASLCFWGVFFTIAQSAALALFADSAPRSSQQERQALYATKSTLTSLAFACGPLVALTSTLASDNDWRLERMPCALLPGFLLMPVMCYLLTLFEEVDPEAAALQVSLLERGGAGEAEDAATDRARRPGAARPGTTWVPYLLLAAELITSVGAGMTVKFFGLWFKNVHKVSPAGLAALSAATPVAIAVAVQFLNRLARASPYGPVPAVLALWLTSVGCLLAMAVATDWRGLMLLHLLRTSLANCKEPIARAILADAIPSSQRGRWNAVGSLTSMTWTGSAALGGFLCDRYGYGRTFVFTAVLYVFAALFWIPLVWMVPAERPAKKERHKF
uniref:Major facilitator superfamily (MFS) profile domain-containing protein n=1 Tax=Zooxanthella nutricula TaxID=1333877 RepID=A0A7S2PTU0_9DINO